MLRTLALFIMFISLPSLATENPLDYVFLDVTCVGQSNAGREYIAIKPSTISVEDSLFSMTGFKVKFPDAFPIGSLKKEKSYIKYLEAEVDFGNSFSLLGCSKEKSLVRTLGSSKYRSYSGALEYIPFQDQCAADEYNMCINQVAAYSNALEMARSQSKPLIVAYGYSGCSWCDSMIEYLRAQFSEKAIVLPLAYAWGNRSGRTAFHRLNEISMAQGNFDASEYGLPLVFVVNGDESKIKAIDPEPHEDRSRHGSYHFDQLDKLIDSGIDAVK